MVVTETQEQSRPDWETIEHGVECPLCEYNLRGLVEPRCPECGYIFEWWEVLDPKRRKHEYLFEHHRESNLWSWRKTVVGGLRPGKFWTTLHPTQPARSWRLLIYALSILLIASLPAWLEIVVGTAPAPGGLFWYGNWRWSVAMEAGRNFPWSVLGDAMWLGHPPKLVVFHYVIASLALPVGMYVLLMIFQGTMRRVSVRQRHVVRCIVY